MIYYQQKPTIIHKIIIFTFFLIFTLSYNAGFAQNTKEEDLSESTAEVKTQDEKNDAPRFSPIAVVQILNKTTAKNSIVDLRISQKVNLGAISLKAHKCWQAPLEQKPETKILLEVFENKNSTINSDEQESKRIFLGWIFASSPSISGIQHPIYDITSITCKNK